MGKKCAQARFGNFDLKVQLRMIGYNLVNLTSAPYTPLN